MSRDRVYKTGLGVMLMALFAVILVRYAEPILDGDVFWHLAYAQQMLEHHTLVPNPTLYSWTPVNNQLIYCAWLSELALLGIWKVFGLSGLFVMRYLVIAAIAGFFWSTIRRAQFNVSPAALLVILTWRFSPDIAFSRRQLMHLGTAWTLCAVAVCLTPYGIRYPLQNLIELFAWGSDRPDGVWNISNFPIYATGATHLLSQPQIFAILAAAVIVLFVANAKR